MSRTPTILAMLVILGIAGPAAAAVVDPAAAAACGPGYAPQILCGNEEVLCVPEGCGEVSCVSCCPPCGPDCGPDPGSPQCQGANCVCGASCDCFTATIDRSKMAPLMSPGPMAVLALGLLLIGLLVARRRMRASANLASS